MSKGWKNEAARHSLAARGVKTRPMPRRYQKWIETHRPAQPGATGIVHIVRHGKFKGYLPGDDRYQYYEEYELRGKTYIIGRDPKAANYEVIAEIPGHNPPKSNNEDDDEDDDDEDRVGRRTRHVEPGEYTYEDADEDEPHKLTKEEWVELRDLIGVMEVSDVYGSRDVTRRDRLEHKATEEELMNAWLANGLYGEDFEEVYN